MSVKFVLILFVILRVSNAAVDLPRFNVDDADITVSGMSSGGIFATQFHVAYSATIKGCGTWAGIPYLCYSQHGFFCMNDASVVSTNGLIAETDRFWNEGFIDEPSYLAGSR